ncbi:Transcriptional regulatory protein SIN3 [Ceratocystis lukuohia]|uniref:Transcriptional regulatory protein SIN3 n=1 Tax=Ceratocystis lukuohia TaxID=2019550 RepID=A0ABR4MTA2_9PEZI
MNNQNQHTIPRHFEREREMEDHRQRALNPPEEIPSREREQAERQGREQYPPGPTPPHHSNAGSLPIHQPVASRLPGAIHSPGGLLAGHGSALAPIPLGAPPGSGPASNFGTPIHDQQGRPFQNSVNGPGQHQMYPPMPHNNGPMNNAPMNAQNIPQQPGPGFTPGMSLQDNQRAISQTQFGPASGGHPPPPSQGPAIAQGQQPILNDALTYLDQVKVQFHEQPDVYNRFLDIMKDFKSQAIDTPGVINRVSDLFAGHPNLIQGFNTFLPPGYRIECGANNDPNTIRVTTPMGTTVQSIAGKGPQLDSNNPGTSQPFYGQRGGNWPPQQAPQHSIESPEASFSNPAQNGAPMYGPGNVQGPSPYDAPGQIRNVSGPIQGLPGIPPAGAPGPRNVHTPTPGGGPAPQNGAIQQQNMEKRGPVEFNHAISYVNKIKNRFQDRPEIYKQFLEILQTYQRESKAITEVYAQVTSLFHSAPDLLEDFKQFLPETTGQTKTTPGRSGDDIPAVTSALMQTPQPNRDGQKMPPLGSFAPPASASKDTKKRPRIDKTSVAPTASPAEPSSSNLRTTSNIPTGVKRAKIAHKNGTDMIEPTLTPLMPEPIPPQGTPSSSQDDLAFFDRVKKYLGNKSTMVEFIKLCNLFSQQIIDRTTLYHRGLTYLQGNPELTTSWKHFLDFEPQDQSVVNRPMPPTDKVSLSNCRGYGPSYRLLPKRERLKPCSGRDELCNSVLNDDWASHPTWASEDSGFVAHRKNAFEEGLHRIEEERHDYDFYISANLKCIQLLEPIAQQMLVMSPNEQDTFRMPAALAGQSTSIFKRVCKKIYGDRGIEVVNDLFNNPFAVVPIVLARMKHKDEEWRFSQREWEKVWRSQTEAMHLRSLDHMGILVKQNDKRNLSAKHLVDLIKTRHENQRRERQVKGKTSHNQFVWGFEDKDVVMDLLRLMLLYISHSAQHSISEKERILEFFESFVPAMFDLPEEMVLERMPKIQLDSSDEEEHIPYALSNGRRKTGRKGDLLRGVLDPGRNSSRSRGQKDGSVAGSKETTPDANSSNDEEMADFSEDTPAVIAPPPCESWLNSVPTPAQVGKGAGVPSLDKDFKADGMFKRPWYNFFCNQTVYVFLSLFNTLYTRLCDVKNSTDSVKLSIARLTRPKPGKDIGFIEERIRFFDAQTEPSAFWPRTLELVEDYIAGEVDEPKYQEILRHYFMISGWKLYTIQDLLKTLCRLALTSTSSDAKEKTPEIIAQYLASRDRDETSFLTEINMRKFVEKCVKDGEMFAFSWFPETSVLTVRWLQREDTTFHIDDMQLQERWQYYVSAYLRPGYTEGVNVGKMSRIALVRNFPFEIDFAGPPDESALPECVQDEHNLGIGICMSTAQIVWNSPGVEYSIYDRPAADKETWEQRLKTIDHNSQYRSMKLKKLTTSSDWIKNATSAELEQANARYTNLVQKGPQAEGDIDIVADADVTIADADATVADTTIEA